jgi:hypothetical protein
MLIIFNKTQQVSFQRFAISVLSGATLMLVFGVVHGLLHHLKQPVELGSSLDARTILLAAAVGIIFAVIYFYQTGAGAWSQETSVLPRKVSDRTLAGFDHSGDIRRLFAYLVAGNILLIGFGVYRLVWLPILFHTSVVTALGSLALASVAVFLPLNYAALLKLDACTEDSTEELYAFAQGRFYGILYWVLVAYWACLFAAYLVLLLYSQAYCQFLVC